MTHTSLPLDSNKVRALFPAFDEASLKGQAFFENAGGSYTSKFVLDRLENYYRQTKIQPYSAYPASMKAGKAMDIAYQRIGTALGLDESWIHFGPSTSANAYVLSQTFAQKLKAGDAIILTNQDHEANHGFWRRLERVGVEIRQWNINPDTALLDPNDLENLLDDKVKFVAFPHGSNIVGAINPAKQICQIIHDAGALAIVDGVSYAPHGLPDVSDIDADIYFFSAYKTFGPHVGVMAIRPELAASLPNQGHHFNNDKLRYRLTPAGPDHAQIAAMSGVADHLEAIANLANDAMGMPTQVENNLFRQAHSAIRAQETILMQPLLDWLSARNDMRLIGPSDAKLRLPTIAVALKASGREMSERLAKHHIMAGGGNFYGQRTLEGLGLNPEHGVLRLSFVHYTTPEEIDRLIKALGDEL